MRRSPAALVLAATLAACASSAGTPSTRQRAYVAPTDQTVVSSTEEAQGPRPEHTIWVRNESTVPITVSSVTLRQCENIQQPCETPMKLNLKLAPGSRAVMRRVAPKNVEQSFGYRYTFAWRADSSTTAATLTALAAGGESSAHEKLAALKSAEADRAATVGVRDEDLREADLARLANVAASLRVEPDSLVMKPGDVVSLYRVHVILLGAQGERLGRVWPFQWRMMPGPVLFTRPDSLIAVRAGSTTAEFTVPQSLLPGRATPLPSATLNILVRE